MLRVAEQYTGTDTGRQRRANEDSHLARSPLFVVADGMGGAQAGEVASSIAIDVFQPGLKDAKEPEHDLADLARVANARIHELSHEHAEQAGMGTTLTAIYVGEHEVAIAHVGDSRAYCLRDGELLRLTDDHTLVDELLRQGRLTPQEAIEHPQRSVITRALGPEGVVDVDTRSFQGRGGDVYLICSDGLTTMLSEEQILSILLAHHQLREAGEALIAAANAAGGRDNITVVLVRLEEVGARSPMPPSEQQTVVGMPAVAAEQGGGATKPSERVTQTAGRAPEEGGSDPQQAFTGAPPQAATALADRGAPAAATETAVRRLPRTAPPREPPGRARRRLRLRRAKSLALTLAVLALLASAGYLALQHVYFIATDSRGLVTLYQGVPYQLPGSIDLYSRQYVSGVSASQVPASRRKGLLDHHLRTESNAGSEIRSIELELLE